MNKKDLIRAVAARTEQPQAVAQKVVDAVFSVFTDALAEGDDVVIPHFGRFSMRKVAEHKGFNPRTKEAVVIPERERVTFRAFKDIALYSRIYF